MMVANVFLMLVGLHAVTSSPAGLAVQPVTLVTRETGDRVEILVKGDSAASCDVSYELYVNSGGATNRNRSIQRGQGKLLPRQPVVLARTVIAKNIRSEWTATLQVKACSGKDYEVVVRR